MKYFFSTTGTTTAIKFLEKIQEIDVKAEQTCLHLSCPRCDGTGTRKDGLGACVHMISCPCHRCSMRC